MALNRKGLFDEYVDILIQTIYAKFNNNIMTICIPEARKLSLAPIISDVATLFVANNIFRASSRILVTVS